MSVLDERSGLEKVVLKSSAGETLEVTLYGAHITSWVSPTGEDLLFMSSKAIYKPPKAIRGGVPICFPQFGQYGPLGQHGFCRNSFFTLASASQSSATLVFKPSEANLEAFPYPFELTINITLNPGTLLQELIVKNTGDKEFSFTGALHTYYRVSSIDHTKIKGLKGVTYTDALQNKKEIVEDNEFVTFASEVDRVYLDSPATVKILDEAGGRVFTIEKTGFQDAVVWNPWIEKAQALADFDDEEYKTMLCIEPAQAGSGAVKLPAGDTWSASQTISWAAA